jgi:hypothetical protein
MSKLLNAMIWFLFERKINDYPIHVELKLKSKQR